jgi:hypothetical protein
VGCAKAIFRNPVLWTFVSEIVGGGDGATAREPSAEADHLLSAFYELARLIALAEKDGAVNHRTTNGRRASARIAESTIEALRV